MLVKKEEIKEKFMFLCIKGKKIKKDDDCSEAKVIFSEGEVYVVESDSLGFFIYNKSGDYNLYLPKNKDDDKAWTQIDNYFTLFEPGR